MTEMVERVARAMCRAAMIDPDWCDEPLSARGGKPQWRYKVDLARAAITAMREPTDEMIWAGGTAMHDGGEDSVGVFTAMIDAAVAPASR